MPIQEIYTRGGTNGIASYDWYAIADGIGYITLYGAKTQNNWILTPQKIWSDDISTTGQTGNTSGLYTQAFIASFALTFNMPKRVKGTLLASVPFLCDRITSATDVRGHIIVRFYKNTTEIAAASSAILKDAGTLDHASRALISVVIPATKFRKSDDIKIVTELWTFSDANFNRWAIGHDPMDRKDMIGTSITTSNLLQFDVPFEVQL